MKESLLEVLWMTKQCLTTIWFWIPVLHAAYILLQLWMIFYIHPLTLLILPVVLSIYGILLEEGRIEAQYGIPKTKLLQASHGLGEEPKPIPSHKLDIEKAVQQYSRTLKEEEKNRNHN